MLALYKLYLWICMPNDLSSIIFCMFVGADRFLIYFVHRSFCRTCYCLIITRLTHRWYYFRYGSFLLYFLLFFLCIVWSLFHASDCRTPIVRSVSVIIALSRHRRGTQRRLLLNKWTNESTKQIKVITFRVWMSLKTIAKHNNHELRRRTKWKKKSKNWILNRIQYTK